MAGNEIGLEAFWHNKDYNKGQAEYVKGIMEANKATDSAVAGMENVSAAGGPGGLGGMLSGLAGSLGMTTTGMLALGGAVVVGLGALKLGYEIVSGFVDKIKEIAPAAIEAGSRVQQLGYIAQILGQKQGIAGEEVISMVNAVRAQGISMEVANMLIAQSIRYEIDLADAVKLATVAQDAATIANEGSSEALEGILHGIVTGRPAYLKFHGLMVDGEEAFKAYAEAMNIVGRELTTTEKVQATVNAALKEGERISGAYAISMTTFGKQLGTLKSRLIPDFLATLGAPFQQGAFNFITGINKMIDSVTKMMQEGGALYPIMVKLGAIFAIITEPVKQFGEAFDEAGEPIANFVDKIIQTAQNMFTWGVDMMVNLATGIIEGASTAITAAINWVSNLLTSWFAPGSPPRVAPEIDEWGAETMEEYLHGFQLADFGILKTLQSSMQAAMSGLVAAGELGEEAGKEIYLSLTKGLIAAMSTGELTAEFLEEIRQAGGAYGDELAELTQKQFELAEATKAIEAAEKALTDARKRESAAGVAVNKGLMEYNQMLREGASKEQLDAKLAEINANKEAQKQAAKEVTEKEAALVAQKEQVESIRDQISYLQQLIQAMADLAKAQKDIEPPEREEVTPPGGAGGGAGAGIPEPELPGGGGAGDMSGVLDKMRDAILAKVEEIKAKLRAKWEEIKTQIKDAWNAAVERVKEAWGRLWGIISPVWENIKTRISEWWENLKKGAGDTWSTVTTTISEWLETIKGEIKWFTDLVKGWWEEHKENIIFVFTTLWEKVKGLWDEFIGIFGPAIENSWEAIKKVTENIWELIKETLSNTWDAIKELADKAWETIKKIFSNVWDAIKKIFEDALEIIGNIFDIFAAVFKGDWETVWNEIKDNAELVWDTIKTIFSTAFENLELIISAAWDSIKIVFETAWENLKLAVEAGWENIKTAISTGIENAISIITNLYGRFKSIGENIINSIKEGVMSVLGGLIESISGAVQDAIGIVGKLLDMGSPSKVFMNFGKMSMKGFELGIQANANLPKQAMAKATVGSIAQAAVPITMGTTNYYQPNITMHTNINSPMNVQQLESLIVRTVKKGMTS